MIFEFYWSWHEDYRPWLFEHDCETETNFEQDCKTIMLATFEDYMSSLDKYSWASLPDWMEFSLPKFEEYGYERIKPVSYGLWGGYIVRDKYDEESVKIFPKRIYKKMCAWNKKLEAIDAKEIAKEIAKELVKEKNVH